jgi:hypothetical protein
MIEKNSIILLPIRRGYFVFSKKALRRFRNQMIMMTVQVLVCYNCGELEMKLSRKS